jgi:hypothetical protein
MMANVTGTLSIKHGTAFYTAYFEQNGWVAAELIQYLDDLYRDEAAEVSILKLLGYTLRISQKPPRRGADHWVEVDLAERLLISNSELIRKAVKQASPEEDEPYWEPALKRIYSVLDALDFTVKLRS